MPSTKPYTQLKDPEFLTIKRLQRAGVNQSMAAEITGRSQATISRIYSVNDFTGYKESLHTYFSKKNERKAIREAVATTTDTNTPTPAPAPVVPKVTQEDTLVRIANALERLANAWESSPKRTGLFNK